MTYNVEDYDKLVDQLIDLTIEDKANPTTTTYIKCLFEIVENNMYIVDIYRPVKQYLHYKLTTLSLGTLEQRKLSEKYSKVFRSHKKYKPSQLRYTTTVAQE